MIKFPETPEALAKLRRGVTTFHVTPTLNVNLTQYPTDEWGVFDSRGGRVRMFDDEGDAREHAVSTAAGLAARAASEIFNTEHRIWDVEISPSTAPEDYD